MDMVTRRGLFVMGAGAAAALVLRHKPPESRFLITHVKAIEPRAGLWELGLKHGFNKYGRFNWQRPAWYVEGTYD